MSLETELMNFLQDPDRKAQLMKAAEDALSERITQQFKWGLPDEISAVCTEFIKEEVAPKVREHLLANKGAIITAAKKAADEIGEKLAASLVERAEKNIEGYAGRQLVEGLFK